MYQFSYGEIINEAAAGSRERERAAVGRSIELLQAAEANGARSREAVEALLYTRRLWAMLLEDLARTDNELPTELRASLVSIGLWIMREAEKLRLDESANFRPLIEVSTILRDGLK
jgi:flagellar protein FlaF